METMNVNVICYSSALMVMQLLISSSNVSWFIISPKGCDPTCHLAAFEGQLLKECSASSIPHTHKLIQSYSHLYQHTYTHKNTDTSMFYSAKCLLSIILLVMLVSIFRS